MNLSVLNTKILTTSEKLFARHVSRIAHPFIFGSYLYLLGYAFSVLYGMKFVYSSATVFMREPSIIGGFPLLLTTLVCVHYVGTWMKYYLMFVHLKNLPHESLDTYGLNLRGYCIAQVKYVTYVGIALATVSLCVLLKGYLQQDLENTQTLMQKMLVCGEFIIFYLCSLYAPASLGIALDRIVSSFAYIPPKKKTETKEVLT